MNERIKQLAELSKTPKTMMVDGVLQSVVTIDAERFAKLIVRECVGVVENLSPGYNDYRNQIEDAFRGDCVGKIREHFGVKE